MRLLNIFYKNYYDVDQELYGRDYWLQFDDRCLYLTMHAPSLRLCDAPADGAELIPVKPVYDDSSCPDPSFFASDLTTIVDDTDAILFCFENGSVISFDMDFVYPPSCPIWVIAFYHAHWLQQEENQETNDVINELIREGKRIEPGTLSPSPALSLRHSRARLR